MKVVGFAVTGIALLFACAPASAPTDDDQRAELPDVAQIVCDGQSVDLMTPRVAPQRGGVHVWLTNQSGQDMAFGFVHSEGQGAGTNAPASEGTLVLDMPPGDNEVNCTVGDQDPNDPQLTARLEVVDPEGIFVAVELQCPEGRIVGSTGDDDGSASAGGGEGDLIDVARNDFSGLQDSDVVERAGYPESLEAWVRVVRDDEIVAVARYFDVKGRWERQEVDSCGEVQ